MAEIDASFYRRIIGVEVVRAWLDFPGVVRPSVALAVRECDARGA